MLEYLITHQVNTNYNDYLKELVPTQVVELRLQSNKNPLRYPFVCGSTSDVKIKPIIDHNWTEREQDEPKSVSFLDISKATEMVLGLDGVARLNNFREYEAGWNFGDGAPISPRSLSAMEYFINQFFSFQIIPSIFMSNDGNLLLGWEDSTGKQIELEFFEDSIGYFIESLDEENEIALNRDEISLLVDKLHQI